jgi:hypothetical protein
MPIAALERREATRHEVSPTKTSVHMMDWNGPQVRRARLLNISSSGALLSTDFVPALHEPIRLRLDVAKEIGWVSAMPVRSESSGEVGIRFFRPVPLYFLRNRPTYSFKGRSVESSDSTQ